MDKIWSLELRRLDPHGKESDVLSSMTLKANEGCKVCHNMLEKKMVTKNNIDRICKACHNKIPNSGLNEHQGKDLAVLKGKMKGKIDCMTCHRPHRAFLSALEKQEEPQFLPPSFLTDKLKYDSILKDFIWRPSKIPMLHTGCTDCHNENDLP